MNRSPITIPKYHWGTCDVSEVKGGGGGGVFPDGKLQQGNIQDPEAGSQPKATKNVDQGKKTVEGTQTSKKTPRRISSKGKKRTWGEGGESVSERGLTKGL